MDQGGGLMIEIYTGTVGSGKSYHALQKGLEHISPRHNQHVIANFPVKFKKRDKCRDYWTYKDTTELDVNYLVKFSIENGLKGRQGSGLLIIDEASLLFNARDWQKGKNRVDWIKFFVNSRKLGYDVILIAQDLRMLDRQIRTVAEFEVRHVLMNQYIWFKFLPFTTFGIVTKWTGANIRGSVRFGILLPWIANRYDTMSIFGVNDFLTDAFGGLRTLDAVPPALGEGGPQMAASVPANELAVADTPTSVAEPRSFVTKLLNFFSPSPNKSQS